MKLHASAFPRHRGADAPGRGARAAADRGDRHMGAVTAELS